MLKKLIERPIAVTMTLIAVIVMGLVAANLLPVSLMPKVNIPRITVVVKGSLPAEELNVMAVRYIESALMQVSHIKDIHSETREGIAVITAEFDYGADIDYTFIEVNEKIDNILGSLPEAIERPSVIKTSADDIPAFYMNIRSKGDSKSFTELSAFVRSVISKRIEQLPEVAMVDISGISDSEILIVPDAAKLASLGIDERTIATALQQNNIKLHNLTIRDGEYHYNVRFNVAMRDASDIANINLKIGNKLFKVGDVATVREQPARKNGFVLSEGVQAVSVAVIKQSDAKMAQMQSSIEGLVEELRADHPDIVFEISRDQTQLLRYSIDNLLNNLWVGAVLACLIIFLFMKDLRSPLIVVITIPLTLVVSMLFFYIFGITINIISLSGLILGVGLMVDNSIVVIDNITQWWDRGSSLKESVVKATVEVFPALLSSVLTTCSIFIPMIFLSGIVGAIFYDQAMAVTITLFSSLAVSVLVIPVYYYLFYKKAGCHTDNRFLAKISGINYKRFYEHGMRWMFRHQKTAYVICLAMVIGIFFLYNALQKETLPQVTTTDTLLHIEWNDKISSEENGRRVSELLEYLSPYTEQTTAMVGVQDFVLMHTEQTDITESIIYLKSSDSATLERLKESVAEYLSQNRPSAAYTFGASGNIFEMLFAAKEPKLVARIQSADGNMPTPQTLNTIITSIGLAVENAEIMPVALQEQILITPRLEAMAFYGIDYSVFHDKLKTILSQNQVMTVYNDDYTVPIIIGDERQSFDEVVRESYIKVDSISYPLSSLFFESRKEDYKTIYSGMDGSYYPVGFEAADKEVGPIMGKVASIAAANDSDVSFSGEYFNNRDMIAELILVLVISLLLLYFILAAQFESLVQPFIILSEIVIDIAGAFFIMYLLGVSINLMSLIGVVVMCGIVINDSILKIDTINRLRRDGYSLIRAIMTGGDRRIKPILMTSLTTILAIVPFLQRGDMGSDLQYSLSVALIGGMIVGTLVSLFFIPLLYYTIYRKRK